MVTRLRQCVNLDHVKEFINLPQRSYEEVQEDLHDFYEQFLVAPSEEAMSVLHMLMECTVDRGTFQYTFGEIQTAQGLDQYRLAIYHDQPMLMKVHLQFLYETLGGKFTTFKKYFIQRMGINHRTKTGERYPLTTRCVLSESVTKLSEFYVPIDEDDDDDSFIDDGETLDSESDESEDDDSTCSESDSESSDSSASDSSATDSASNSSSSSSSSSSEDEEQLPVKKRRRIVMD